MITIPNHIVFVQDITDHICVGMFGYWIFARINSKKKEIICRNLSSHGKLVIPHASKDALVKGQCTIGLMMWIWALEAANIVNIKLSVYGMNVPYKEITLNHLPAVSLCKYDIGSNIRTNSIPLLNVTDIGTVYPMLGELGNGLGSVSLKMKSSDNKVQLVILKCYPKAVHFWKSQLHNHVCCQKGLI